MVFHKNPVFLYAPRLLLSAVATLRHRTAEHTELLKIWFEIQLSTTWLDCYDRALQSM